MSDLSAHTDCLPLAEAKKLLTSMQKPGKHGTWSDWSGEGGSEIESKLEGFLGSSLDALELPAFCSSIEVDSGVHVRDRSVIPNVAIVGGNGWVPPEYGDDSWVEHVVFVDEISALINILIMKAAGMRHYSRPFNFCSAIAISLLENSTSPNLKIPDSTEGGRRNDDSVKRFFAELKQRYDMPDETTSGWLESEIIVGSELGPFSLYMDLGQFGMIQQKANGLIRDLIAKSSINQYSVRAISSIGSTAKFEGELHNVTEPARELLALAAKHNDFPSYDVTYYYLGARAWKDREKSRKKLKEPAVEQLGTVTLENGAVAAVSLGIEKEGYFFNLNFGSDDDLIRFFKSKLFQKTKWHSGAE